nr:hypothetical protein [Sphingomonas sp.]
VQAQAIPIYAESSADSLARNVRILADSPKDFNALVGAGKAALQLADEQSAAGFFGRAEEVHPASPLPKAGMAAALVMSGDPNAALNYFAQAQRLGASAVSLGADRGLAYDLLGNHVAAQADFQAALAGPDRDEARRRLALSLAITGKTGLALTTLAPLMARGDSGAARCRALVLALGGDTEAAKQTLNARMPGSAAAMGPFFRVLPALSSPQKAAAVHLGIFPDSGFAMASAMPVARQPAGGAGNRLASVDQLLSSGKPDAEQTSLNRYASRAPAPQAVAQPPRIQLASIPRTKIEKAASPSNKLIETQRVESSPGGKKIWLQLASGNDEGELPGQFDRIRSKKPSLFEGIGGFVAESGERKRLLIGPFHSEQDARLFGDALETVRIDSFRWVSQPGQQVRQIATQ